MTEKLKPCPFCGGRASIRAVTPVHSSDAKKYGYGDYFVMCENCLTTSNNYNTEERAAEHWNRRYMNG